MKKCKYCKLDGHSATFCYARPKNRVLAKKQVKQIGKHGAKWLRTRAQWFTENKAESYTCFYCGERLTPKETTLDHYMSRSRRPELRYDMSNLVPCCYRCNKKKGSRNGDEAWND